MSALSRLRSPLRRRALALAIATLVGAAHADSRGARLPAASPWCNDRCDELVIDWNATAYQAIKASDGYADPLNASRALAMMHLAMHDAVNAAQPRFALHAPVDGDRAADPAVAAVAAAHQVLVALYPGQKALLQATLDKSLADAGGASGVARGLALGQRVGSAMLNGRAGDGSTATLPYQPGSQPGAYRFTPGFDFVAHPQWRQVRPFLLDSPSQFRSAPMPALTSAAYAADFNEVKAVGAKSARARRTADETNYASFWYEFSDIGWNRIARVVARDHRQDLWQRARTFALLNAALADAYIAGWDSKFHHDAWRPITAIHAAETDGNAQTHADASYEPLLPTPPVQDYPSTHSALGAAAAAVLADSFGRDRIRFSVTSTTATPSNPLRSFDGFAAAARENADSRVKAGLHFRFATRAGLVLGEAIGQHAVRRRLVALD